MITVREYQPTDLDKLRTIKLRESDQREAKAFTGWEPNDALVFSVERSSYVQVVEEDGDIIAVFGLNTDLSVGIPWFVATDRVHAHKIKWLKLTRKYIDEIKTIQPILWNCVAKEHTEAVEWLEWLGFHIDKSKEWYFFSNDVPFHQFFMGV